MLRDPIPDGVRPTSARVREALFSMVGPDLSGRRVLDAFGGAGVVGLEAWSRGALVTVFERDRRVFKGIEARGKALGATWEVVNADVLAWAGRLDPFDGIFADPPYAMEPGAVIAALGPLAQTWFVIEVAKGAEVPEAAGALTLDRRRVYGGTELIVYR